ncbi:MAG: 50S ribosomal protein L9 [Mycoplasma sp.]
MKVILLTDVANLGKKNDILDVNDGYAKNFLFKTKKAIAYTDGSLKKLSKELEHQKEIHDEEVYQANLLKDELESKEIMFSLKSNHGNAFGKISSKQLIEEINKTNKLINKYMLKKAHEWGLGNHIVEIELHKEVIAKVKINVVGQENAIN